MKIVIVDDSVLLRDRLRDSLSVIDNIEIVGEAFDGKEALLMIKDRNPDFVILDIRMPDMNGIEVLEKLKEGECKSKICIFTNYPYQQYKQRCLDGGANYFFDKNQDFSELIETVTLLSKKNR